MDARVSLAPPQVWNRCAKGKYYVAWDEIARNYHIRAGVTRDLGADPMLGAGICAESGWAGGERVQGHVDRNLDAG